ncbi:MAG: cytochrome P450 [Pseudomonadota bacterium]
MHRFSQSTTDADFVQNPYLAYDRARALGDIVWWDEYAMPAALSHRAVRLLLTDRRLGRAPPVPAAPAAHLATWNRVDQNSMLELEPPRHTKLRGLVLRAFTGRRVAQMADGIQTLCHQLIDAFPAGPFDLLQAYAQPLPVIVIAKLLGVPLDRTDDLLRWSNTMVAMYQTGRSHAVETAAEQATQDFVAYLDDVIAHRRTTPGADLITDLIDAEQNGDRLTAPELISTIILLLNAGHEATVHTIGNGVNILAALPPQPITDATIEEVLRYDPPLHMFTRWAYDDIDCFGHAIAKGTQVACVLAAANRDSAVFQAPHHFDATRAPGPHQSFGAGIHFCVGAPLARLELRLGLKTLFDRCPDLHITTPPRYANTYHFHGLERLMIQTRATI